MIARCPGLIGEGAREALECDLKLEQAARPALQEVIAYCETVRDYITREILEDIKEGLQNWLQSQAGSVP